MQRQKTIKYLKFLWGCTIAILFSLCFVSILTILISSPNVAFPGLFFGTAPTTASVNISLVDSIFRRSSLHSQISSLQSQVGILLEQLHTESSESKVLAKFSNQVLQIAISLNNLADGLSGLHGSSASPASNELSSIHEDLTETEETDDEEGSIQGMVFRSFHELQDLWHLP
ncbi:hypothetical protein SLEP1_g27547 [Rubroshorea leprosula]|uniref:Uncharacterized protein n=1 Tax=Rubroshorea leprosula TaxID=152421 RepID=A0AAV5JQS4_9ROSI|nr:hypothetical protein SLEP1_g27547 [Rubroshorea leprosula]